MPLVIVPLTFREANELVAQWHRHHQPLRGRAGAGHRFSIGALDTSSGRLVGAAIVCRPVSRCLDHRRVAEVARLVTDGTRNACSILYAAAARAAQAMGYERIQTYILEAEHGSSLRAAGWRCDAHVRGNKPWTGRSGRRGDQPTCPKWRWVRELNPPRP